MKLVIPLKSRVHCLRWAQYLLFAIGVSTLGYSATVLLDSWNFQRNQEQQLEQQIALNREARRKSGSPGLQTVLPSTLASTSAAAGSTVGRIEISRLGLSAIILEGTTAATLRHAVGHISSTTLPGTPGNIGLAGHRDTFFRSLRNIHQSDLITLTTARGEEHYRVVSTKIVDPHDLTVLDSTTSEVLTLVTCYPFYFVGSAPDRFIVRAEKVI